MKPTPYYVPLDLLAGSLGFNPPAFAFWTNRLRIPAGVAADGSLVLDADALQAVLTVILSYTSEGLYLGDQPLRRLREFLYGPARPHRTRADFLLALATTLSTIRADRPSAAIVSPVQPTLAMLPDLLRPVWSSPGPPTTGGSA